MKHSIIPVLAAAGLALAACGQSAEDNAQAQVCDARADIQKQVDELRGLTITTASVDGVKSNLNAIKADLGKIKDAQGRLSDDRRPEVQSALNELADSYRQTLGQIDCG